MKIPLTISQFILENETLEASGRFTSIMSDIALGCRMTASKLRYGNFSGLMSKRDTTNTSGDIQTQLDILANDIFISLAENNGNIVAIASEEMPDLYYISKHKPNANYVLILDPLDGSSNLDINAPVATIFSICKVDNTRPTEEEVLKAAVNPVAAGICVYGLAITLSITTGNGVHGFTQDLESGVFFYTHPFMKISHYAKELAINFSNRNYWNNAVLRYVDECFLGEQGPRGRYFNTRWYASAAAELYRILNRGGIFIYPACSNGKPNGVIRKLYEAWPMAVLVEAAGGLATNGRERMLDVPAQSLHEKTPFAMGTVEEIEILSNYHNSEK